MEWQDLMLKVVKSKNHLSFLEALWNKPRSLSQVPINYKTAHRISKEFLSLGLISQRENKFSLTPLGKFIACFLLGKFQSHYPKPEEILTYIDGDFIGRKDVIKEILWNVRMNRDVVIIGEKGIGKTALLKHLKARYLQDAIYVKARPSSRIVVKIAEKLGVPHRGKRVDELLEEIERIHHNPSVLLVDELERATKGSIYLLKQLRRMKFIIIGAGITYPKNLEFYREIRLRELSRQEAKALVINSLRKELRDVPEELVNLITSTTGNPEKLGLECTQAILLHREGELSTREKIHEHFGEPKFPRKFVLLPARALLPLGFLLLSLRFFFYGIREFEIGYIIGTIAYFLYFIRSLKKHKIN